VSGSKHTRWREEQDLGLESGKSLGYLKHRKQKMVQLGCSGQEESGINTAKK
jgi:hypothetical protein